MSALEIISEIKQMPRPQRQKIYRFVSEEMRHEEDRRDHEAADRAQAEPGENIPWAEARKRLGWA